MIVLRDRLSGKYLNQRAIDQGFIYYGSFNGAYTTTDISHVPSRKIELVEVERAFSGRLRIKRGGKRE